MKREITTGDVPVKNVLKHAEKLTNVIVAGFDADGEFYLASSSGNAFMNLWLLEKAKEEVMKADD